MAGHKDHAFNEFKKRLVKMEERLFNSLMLHARTEGRLEGIDIGLDHAARIVGDLQLANRIRSLKEMHPDQKRLLTILPLSDKS